MLNTRHCSGEEAEGRFARVYSHKASAACDHDVSDIRTRFKLGSTGEDGRPLPDVNMPALTVGLGCMRRAVDAAVSQRRVVAGRHFARS